MSLQKSDATSQLRRLKSVQAYRLETLGSRDADSDIVYVPIPLWRSTVVFSACAVKYGQARARDAVGGMLDGERLCLRRDTR